MLETGAIEEVKEGFKKIKLPIENKASFRAIGVNEIKQFIDNKMDFKDLQNAVLVKTRQYAKRQRTWFRSKFVTWNNVKFSEKKSIKELLQDIENN